MPSSISEDTNSVSLDFNLLVKDAEVAGGGDIQCFQGGGNNLKQEMHYHLYYKCNWFSFICDWGKGHQLKYTTVKLAIQISFPAGM